MSGPQQMDTNAIVACLDFPSLPPVPSEMGSPVCGGNLFKVIAAAPLWVEDEHSFREFVDDQDENSKGRPEAALRSVYGRGDDGEI